MPRWARRRAPRAARCARSSGFSSKKSKPAVSTWSTWSQPSRVARRSPLDPLEPVGERPLEDLPVEGLLRREVVQQARAADADGLGDVVQRRAVVAVLGEARASPRPGSAPGCRAARPRHGARHGHRRPASGIGHRFILAPTYRSVGRRCRCISSSCSSSASSSASPWPGRHLRHHRLPAPGAVPPGGRPPPRSSASSSGSLTWLHTGIKPRQWVAVHRKHHAYTDVEGDPHSPRPRGLGRRSQLTNAALYRRVARDPRAGRPLRQGPARRPLGPGAVRPRAGWAWRRHRPPRACSRARWSA